jgi:hypothetical protein
LPYIRSATCIFEASVIQWHATLISREVFTNPSSLALPSPFIGSHHLSLPQHPNHHHGRLRTPRRRLRSRTRTLCLRRNSIPFLLDSLQGVRHPHRFPTFNPTNPIQPWPIVERFLKEQVDGAIGADVGCGNGKYLAVNKRVFIVGSDRYV